VAGWPSSTSALAELQSRLAGARPAPWEPPGLAVPVGGCAVCSLRRAPGPGAAGDPAWAAAVVLEQGRVTGSAACRGAAGAAFASGQLALREGPLLEEVVRRLPAPPAVLLVHAAGRDHPRRSGLALMLGALLDLPTVGVTTRPLRAEGPMPEDRAGATSPLRLDGEVVASWVRVRAGLRPVVAHAAWRTGPETAAALVLATSRVRMPEPLRLALEMARTLRAREGRRTR
jgi:deoxyribonuclease V